MLRALLPKPPSKKASRKNPTNSSKKARKSTLHRKTFMSSLASSSHSLTPRLATIDDGRLMATFDQIINPTLDLADLETRNRRMLSNGFRAVFFLLQGKEIAFAIWNEHPTNLPPNSFLLGNFAILEGEKYRRKGYGTQTCEMLRRNYWLNNVNVFFSVGSHPGALEFWKKMSKEDPYLRFSAT